MLTMKRLSKSTQLTAMSHVELVNLAEHEAGELAARGVTYFDRKPKRLHLLNGLVLWFAALDDADKMALGRDVMGRLERFIREEPAVERSEPHGRPPAPRERGTKGA
jgi:hypothetical protein